MLVDTRTSMKMKPYSRLKLASNALFAFAPLWFGALTLRMGAPTIEFFFGDRPHWFKWIYYLPRAFPKGENARWFQYWPLLLPFAVVAVAHVLQAMAESKAKRAERIYYDENCN